MALAVARPRTPAVTGGYRRILVPLLGAESDRALETACRLASEHRATVTAVSVVEVPPALPLDARMDEEELDCRDAFDRAEAIADTYGVGFARRQIRARNLAAAVIDELEAGRFELLVVAASRRTGLRKGAAVFDRAVQQILRRASCRVLVVAPPR
jgi:nucleotide-binding universal stress UspA family protein